MKKLILLSIIVSIQLFGKVINGVYVPEPNEQQGNEIEIYPNLSEQMNKAIEDKKIINQNKPMVEVVINNNEQNENVENVNPKLNVHFNEEELNKVENITNISDLEEDDKSDRDDLKTPYGMEEVVIQR